MRTAEMPLNAVDRHVGARLRARRMLVQMSEEWLAGTLSVSVETLGAYEEGRVRIGHHDLLRCADLLDVPERYFYLGFGAPSPAPEKPSGWRREVDHWFAAHLFPHEGLFLSTARRMTGNPEVAREIVQDTYADLLTGDKWRGIAFPRAYALKAVRSFAGRFLQRSRIVPIELLANMEAVDQTDLNPDAYEILSAKERRAIILQAIEDLPPQCRKVVKLRRLKEMLPRQIAQEMGISLPMVEKHLAKGMLKIADRLSEHEPPLRPLSAGQRDDAATGE